MAVEVEIELVMVENVFQLVEVEAMKYEVDLAMMEEEC